MSIRGFFQRIKDRKAVAKRIQSGEMNYIASAQHYQHLHESFNLYQENNWLVDDLPLLKQISTGSLCEIGCGNGRFLKAALGQYQKLTGVDWAHSPLMVVLPEDQVQFIQADLSQGFSVQEKFDVMCSADFLEHLSLENATNLITQIVPAATYHYHKIACYDDGGSHLTVLEPSHWLKLFKQHDPKFYIHRVYDRRKNGQDIVVVTNYRPLPKA